MVQVNRIRMNGGRNAGQVLNESEISANPRLQFNDQEFGRKVYTDISDIANLKNKFCNFDKESLLTGLTGLAAVVALALAIYLGIGPKLYGAAAAATALSAGLVLLTVVEYKHNNSKEEREQEIEEVHLDAGQHRIAKDVDLFQPAPKTSWTFFPLSWTGFTTTTN